MEELCDVIHSRTTPYHPEGNGQVKRFNRTLLSKLRTLPESYKSHWKEHLNKVVHAYNCTRHESTGYSPFYLIFGRHPCLPIYLVFNLKPPAENKSYPKYVADWQSAMKKAYGIAASKCKAQGDKVKAFYVGDRVLIKNLSERGGPGKLRSYWEDKVHVHRKSPDSPVYQLNPENGTEPIRTLHRNLLFPCGTLLESSSTPQQASTGQQELKPSTTLSKRNPKGHKSQRILRDHHLKARNNLMMMKILTLFWFMRMYLSRPPVVCCHPLLLHSKLFLSLQKTDYRACSTYWEPEPSDARNTSSLTNSRPTFKQFWKFSIG